MKDILREFGINIGLTIAGFAGSLITVRGDGHKDWPTTITSLLAGTLSANYLTPMVVDVLKLSSTSNQYGCAFLLGFLGLHGVELIMVKIGMSKRK